MTIEYRIDHDRRMVFARGFGILTDQDIFGYQRAVWSSAEIAGYNELVDMSDVEKIALPSSQRIQDLAMVSAGMDAGLSRSKFAIVAPDNLAFGLGRMYQTYRELDKRSTKEVAVFRSMKEAYQWLGINEDEKNAE